MIRPMREIPFLGPLPAKVAKVAKAGVLERRETQAFACFAAFAGGHLENASFAGDLDERAAMIEEGANVPRAWAEAFAWLELSGRNGLDTAGRALDAWAARADALGWRPGELLDLATSGEVLALTAESVTLRIGETVRHIRRSCRDKA